MKPKTLKALRESIAHWDRLASGTRKPDELIGVSGCALCELFWESHPETSCLGCPVLERTGQKCCNGTPYNDVQQLIKPAEDEEGYDTPAFKEAAMRELEFLRSLLPEDHLTR